MHENVYICTTRDMEKLSMGSSLSIIEIGGQIILYYLWMERENI